MVVRKLYNLLIVALQTQTIMKKIIVLLSLILIGCKAKHTTTTIIEKDTLRVDKIVKIIPEQLNQIFIDDPCDSITGELKIFSHVITTPSAEVSLKSTEKGISMSVNIDSLRQVWEKEYKSSNKSTFIKKATIEYKNKKLMWYSLILNFILLLWIFRKPLMNKIPFLRILSAKYKGLAS